MGTPRAHKGGYSTDYTAKTARRNYRCESCGHLILKGDRYEKVMNLPVHHDAGVGVVSLACRMAAARDEAKKTNKVSLLSDIRRAMSDYGEPCFCEVTDKPMVVDVPPAIELAFKIIALLPVDEGGNLNANWLPIEPTTTWYFKLTEENPK